MVRVCNMRFVLWINFGEGRKGSFGNLGSAHTLCPVQGTARALP